MGNSQPSSQTPDFSNFMKWNSQQVFVWCQNNKEIKHLSRRLLRLKITGQVLSEVHIEICVEEWGLSWLDSFKLLDERDNVAKLATLAKAGRDQQAYLLRCREQAITVPAECLDVSKGSTRWTHETLIAWLALHNLSHLSILVTQHGLTAKDLPCLTAKALVTSFGCGWTDAFALTSARDELFPPSPPFGVDSDSGTVTPYDDYDSDCEEDLDGFVFLEYDD